MNSNLPDRETLLAWMSAFLDGELLPEEEALLETAMNEDPELLRAFEELSALSVAPPPALSPVESDALTRSILAACAPSAVDDSPEAAAHLASLYIDDALDDGGQARLEELLGRSAALADDVRAFAQSSEAVGAALHALPDAPAAREALAPLPARVEALVADDERLGLLWSAALDGALTGDEERELEALLTPDRSSELLPGLAPLAHVIEAAGAALRAPIEHPDAARAGAAALQAIAAYAAQEEAEAARQRAPLADAPAPAPFSLRRLFARFAPVAAAAACALAFAVIDRPSEPSPGEPPAEWLTAFNLLEDNSAEVQALDSGSHMAAVFATEESQITVIWVAEPEATSDPETGT